MPRARATGLGLHRAIGAPLSAVVLLVCLCGLAGCAREGPEDPALAGPGAGIPMGAIGATGVSFDAPSGTPSLGPAPKGKSKKPGTAPPEPIPDPFEAPDDEPVPPPAPGPGLKTKKPPKQHSPSETTL